MEESLMRLALFTVLPVMMIALWPSRRKKGIEHQPKLRAAGELDQ